MSDLPRYVAFDTETTGLEPGSRIVEMAAISFNERGDLIDSFTSLINPGMPIPADASIANGITQADLDHAPATREVVPKFLSWLPSNAALVIHNAGFDVSVLGWECDRLGLPHPVNPVIDTCAMAKAIRSTRNAKLQTLKQHYGFQIDGDAHRAMPDTEAVRQYFLIARGLNSPICRPFRPAYRFPAIQSLPSPASSLPDHIAAGRAVRLTYEDAKGRISTRRWTPYGYAARHAGIVAHGWCHWAQARRQFRIDRIRAIDAQ
jgi:DNA polymerase III epsilon subunit family exonuclease